MTGGTKEPAYNSVITLGKAQSVFGKTKSGEYGQKDIATDSLFRNSQKEEAAKVSENNKAAKLFTSTANSDYAKGGTKQPDYNSVVTLGKAQQFFGKTASNQYGQKDIAQDQFSRDSSKELQAKKDNAVLATKVFSDSTKSGYDPIIAKPIQESKTSSSSFGKPFATDLVGTQESKNIVIRENNIKNERDFKSYLNNEENKGALFTFYSGNKEVGQTSGPRSYHDFLDAQQKYGSGLTFSTSYPTREKALTETVKNNTDFYSNLPQNYWQGLADKGFISKNNIGEITKSLAINNEVKNRDNLSLLQGSLFSEIHGGPIPTDKGVKNIGPLDNEASSFLKFPFSGEKRSSENIPSTSLFNVIQFFPTLGNKEIELASRGLIGLVDRTAPKLIGVKDTVASKIKSTVANRVLYESPFLNTPKPQEEPKIRVTNLHELEPVGAQIAKQIMGKRPETVTETNMRLSTPIKENPDYNPSTNVFSPKPQPKFDINVKSETPVFRNTEKTSNSLSPKEQAERDRYPAMKDELNLFDFPKTSRDESTVKSSSTSFLNDKSPLPFSRVTKSDSETSPISRQFLGTQYKGAYPSSYLPPSFITTSKTESISPETLNPLGRRGNPPIKKNYKSENPIDFFQTSRSDYVDRGHIIFTNEVFSNKGIKLTKFFGETKSYGVFPPLKEEVKVEPFPERDNPLGRRGKPPVKSQSNNISELSRAFVVDQTRPSYKNEVFSNKGKNLSPGILFGETKPIGALGKTTKESKIETNRPEVYPNGDIFVRGSLQTKDIGLIRFEKYQEKNPPPEKIGDARFQSFVDKKLPKNFEKASIFQSNTKEPKSKQSMLKRSANLFEIKKAEPKKDESVFKSNGGKSQTVLLERPLVKRKLVSRTEQQYDTVYEYKPIPESKSSSASSLLSDFKLAGLSKTSYKSGTKQGNKPMSDIMSKLISGTKIGPKFTVKPKQNAREKSMFREKQITDILSIPKQSTSPKQSQRLTPNMATPQRPKQTSTQIHTPSFRFPPPNQTKNPPPKPPPVIFFGPFGKRGKGKGKEGPTALFDLGVSNIFSSSLNIKGKGHVF